MDLRKYTRKRIDTQNVLNYEYLYCSPGSKYGSYVLCITIEKNEGTAASPGYELMLKLDSTGKILEIMRLTTYYGSGCLCKRLPEQVEGKAQKILDDLVVSASDIKASDLSLLKDVQVRHGAIGEGAQCR